MPTFTRAIDVREPAYRLFKEAPVGSTLWVRIEPPEQHEPGEQPPVGTHEATVTAREEGSDGLNAIRLAFADDWEVRVPVYRPILIGGLESRVGGLREWNFTERPVVTDTFYRPAND